MINIKTNYLHQYIASITKNFKMSSKNKLINAAVKGTNTEIEIRKYFSDIDRTFEEFLGQLRKYEQKLADMADTYKANDKFVR